MPDQVECEQLALAKILCHAAKHLMCTVNGLLLGRIGEGGNVKVTDAIPLFHASSALAAPTEVALSQVHAHCQKAGGAVVGYYHSDARYASAELPAIARRIADKLAAKEPNTVAVVLDNRKLDSFMSGESTNPFDIYKRDPSKGSWSKAEAIDVSISGGLSTLQSNISTLLKQQLHTTLADFDDHLDDISKDWLNPQLATLGKMALPGQA